MESDPYNDSWGTSSSSNLYYSLQKEVSSSGTYAFFMVILILAILLLIGKIVKISQHLPGMLYLHKNNFKVYSQLQFLREILLSCNYDTMEMTGMDV